MGANLLIVICFILFLISAKKYLMPRILKSGEFIVEDIYTWKDITGFLKDPKIRLKIIITLVLLIIYELGTHIYLPGMDLDILSSNQSGFSIKGSSLKHFSVFALGIVPFLNANGLLLLSCIVFPALRKFSRSRQRSSRLINQLVYLLTVILCIVQSYFYWERFQSFGAAHGKMYFLTTVLLLTLGTLIILLLGKGISKIGIGHGISLIIALSYFITLIRSLFQGLSLGVTVVDVMAGLLFMITALILGVWIMRVKRVIMVEDVNTGEKKPLPFSLNQAGIFPVILAITLIIYLPLIRMFGNTGKQIFNTLLQNALYPGHLEHYLVLMLFILSISLIYGILVINPNYMIMRLEQNNLRIIDERQNKKRNILFAAILELNFIWAGVLIVYIMLSNVLLSRISSINISTNMPVIVIAAVISGYLHTFRMKKKNMKEIYKHTEPGEIMVAKSYLETKGINTVTDNDEAYGWLFGFFTGPFATRRLFVEAEDFLKASELMEGYNLKRLVDTEVQQQ